jgi:hypothetical protein
MRGRLALREQELLLRRRLQHQSRLKSSVVLSGMMSDSTRLDLRLAELRGPLLLYSLHPGCDACLANLAFLNKLHAWRACGATVLGVLAGEPRGYPRPRGLPPASNRGGRATHALVGGDRPGGAARQQVPGVSTASALG